MSESGPRSVNPASAPPPRPLLRVLVSRIAIGDGHVRPPVVGEVAALRLSFIEADEDGRDRTSSTVRAYAEPPPGPPRTQGRRWSGATYELVPRWHTRLYGDGWEASWNAPRRVAGDVELAGVLWADLVIGTNLAPTRGRITRASVVSVAWARTPHGWYVVPGMRWLHPVDRTTAWFDSGSHAVDPSAPPGWRPTVYWEPHTEEIGVLVDLDLDDAPA